jgi:acyl carrier protein
MNTIDGIEQKVIKIIAESLNIEVKDINVGSRFKEDLGADSLSTVELMMKLEVEFKTDIPDEEASKILTVADVVSYIKTHVSKPA